MRADLDGRNPKAIAVNQKSPSELVTDEVAVYWINNANGTVAMIAK